MKDRSAPVVLDLISSAAAVEVESRFLQNETQKVLLSRHMTELQTSGMSWPLNLSQARHEDGRSALERSQTWSGVRLHV
jgi:hypothetical protein